MSTPSAPSGYAAHSGSNSHTGGGGWQQPQPGVRLNPNEYPSLSAAAAAAAQAAHHEAAVASGGSGQPVSKRAGALPARPAFPSGTSWADDDRDTSGLGPVHLFGAGARGGTQRHQGEADSTPPEADLLPPPRGHAAPAPSGDWRASGAGGSALLLMPPPAAVHVAATAVHQQQQQQQQQHTQGGMQPAAQPSHAQPQSAASAAASWRKAPSSEGGARHPAGPPAPPVALPQPQFTAERPPLVLSRANVGAMSPAVRASAAAVLAATSSQVGSGHGGETPHAAVSAEQAPHSSSGAPPAPSPLSDVVVMKRVLPLSDGHSGEVRHERRQAPAPAQQQQPAQVKPRPVASTEEAAPPQPAWAPSAAGVAAAPSAAQSSKSGPQPQPQRPGAHVTVLHRPPGSSLPVPPPALPALGSHEIGTLPVAVPLSAVGSHGLAAPQTPVGDAITGGAATGGASGGSGESRRKRGGRRVREADERRASKADHGSASPTRQVQAPPPPQPQQAQPQSGRGGQQKGGKGAPKEVPKPHGAAADVAAAHGGRNGGATRKERGAAGGHLPGQQQAQQLSDHLRGSLHSQSTPHGGGAPPNMLIVTQHGMGGSLMSVGPGGVGSLAPNVHSHNGQHSLSAAGRSAGIQAAGFMLAGSGGAFGGPGAPGGGGGGGQQWRGHSAGGPTPTAGSRLWGLNPAGGPAGPTNNAAQQQQQQQQHSRGQQALGQQQPQPRGHHHAHGQQHSQQAQQQLQQQRGAGVMALGGGSQLGSSFGGAGIPTQGALFGNGGAGQGGSSSGSTVFAAPGGNPFARPFVSTGPGQDASAGGPASSAATSSFGVGGLFVGGSMWAHTPQQLGAPPGGVQGAQVGGGGALFRRGSGASSDQLDAAPGTGGMTSTVWYGAPQQGATGNGWF